VVGKPALGTDGKLVLPRGFVTRSFMLGRRPQRVIVSVPKPPYRVEIHIDRTFSPSDYGQPDTRDLGAQVTFGPAPGTR
jgi:hypothetical protein